MSTMFKRAETQWGGAFVANSTSLSFGTLEGQPFDVALVQTINVQYAQNVTRLYEIGAVNGKARVYYIGGRGQGNVGISRAIGPSTTLAEYFDAYGDVCRADKNNLRISFETGCGDITAFDGDPSQPLFEGPTNLTSFTCRYCVLTQVGFALNSEQFLITENDAMMFSNFEYEEENS